MSEVIGSILKLDGISQVIEEKIQIRIHIFVKTILKEQTIIQQILHICCNLLI